MFNFYNLLDYLLNIFIYIRLFIIDRYNDICNIIYNDLIINNISLKNNKKFSEKSVSIQNLILNNKIDWDSLYTKTSISNDDYILVDYECKEMKYKMVIPHNVNIELNKLDYKETKLINKKIIYAEYNNKDVTNRIKKFAGPLHNFYGDLYCYCRLENIFSTLKENCTLNITLSNGDDIIFNINNKIKI